MKPVEQIKLIDKIGRHLQASMTTRDINMYMSRFNVKTPNLSMADSKWVYVRDILSTVDESIIIRIAKDLMDNINKVRTIFSAKTLFGRGIRGETRIF